MPRNWFPFVIAMLATLLACSQKDRVNDADLMSLSKEGRGKTLIDGEAGQADGIDLKSVYFDYDRATLRPEGKRVLDTHVAWLKRKPKTLVQIEGSCDDRGSEEYNMNLGQRRAAAAKAYLISKGIEASRLSVVSHGRLPGSQEKVRQENRKGAFVVFYGD